MTGVTFALVANDSTYTLACTVTAAGSGLSGAAVHAFDSVTNAYFATSVTPGSGECALNGPGVDLEVLGHLK